MGKLSYSTGEVQNRLDMVGTLQEMISSPYNFRGAVATLSNLPSSGNVINDTYYVESEKYRVTWTGAAWAQSSMDEADYEDELTDLKSAVKADEFSSSKVYRIGEYTTKDGKLYKFISFHTVGNWNENQVVEASLPLDLYDLRPIKEGIEHGNVGELFYSIIENSCLANGVFTDYYSASVPWSQTDYIRVEHSVPLEITTTRQGSDNAFYDSSKNFISTFTLKSGRNLVMPPVNAEYMAISGRTVDILNLTIRRVGRDYSVTPEMFGAKGDGITDDTDAIQNAIASGHIVVMANVYAVSTSLTVGSNLQIDGMNTGEIVKLGTGDFPIFYFAGDSTIEHISISRLDMSGKKHWTGSTVSGDGNDIGLRIYNVNDLVIENCKFTDFGAVAISVTGNNIWVSNNIIDYTGTFSGSNPNYNFGIEYDAENIIISGNRISGVIQGVLSGLVNENAKIIDNNISTNGQHGLYMEGAHHLLISNNIIHDCTLSGIKVQENTNEILSDFDDIIISDNAICDCGSHGVLVVKISGNVDISNVMISGNIIKDCERGVEIIKANDITIASNNINIAKNGGYCIRIADTNNVKISGNNIMSVDAYGIYFYDNESGDYYNDISIHNNYVAIAHTSGITNNIMALRINAAINGLITSNHLLAKDNMSESDGLYLANTSTSITNLYIAMNFVRGFRWDIRALKTDGITLNGNYYLTITGITQS